MGAIDEVGGWEDSFEHATPLEPRMLIFANKVSLGRSI